MAAGNLGSLVLSLGLNGAEFFAGLTKAEYETRKAVQGITNSLQSIKSAVASVAGVFGVGFGINAFKGMIEGAIDAQEELGLLGARAGLTGEQLSTMSRAARLSHTGLEDVASMSARLSKALLESSNATAKSSVVLKALGIGAADAARLLANPAQAVFELAKRINELPEGGTKAAAQLLLLGRAGGTTSAFLAELAQQTRLVVSRTKEEIEAAKQFNDKLVDMGIRTNGLKTALANALLPTLSDVVDALAKMSTGTGSAKDQIDKFSASGAIKEWAENAVIAIATVAEALILVGRLVHSISGSFKVVAADLKSGAASIQVSNAIQFGATPEEFKRLNDELAAAQADAASTLATANENYKKLWNERGDIITSALRQQFAVSELLRRAQSGEFSDPNDRRNQAALEAQSVAREKSRAENERRLRGAINSAAGSGDDPTRKILEAALAALKANTEQEKAVLENRNQYLQAIFDRGESSISEYYAQKQAAQAEDLRITSQNYVAELALIETFIKNSKTERDKAQGEKEKVAATARQQLAIIQSAGKAQQILDDQQRALIEYRHTLDEVNAKMLELQGNTAAAAQIRFDNQNETLRERLTATIARTSSTPAMVAEAKAAKEQLDATERLTVAQARLNDVTARYSNIIGIVGVSQARIDLLLQTGAITEIDAINKKSELAKQYVGALTAEADAAQRLAETYEIGSKQRSDALLIVAQLRLQIDQLAASSDVLAKKFSDIFAGAFSTFLTDLIDHTKSAKQAFTDMAKSIEQQISKIASQNIAERLFGKEGPLGGVGGFFSGLFGGKGGAAAGADASVAALGASATTADAGLITLAASLATASAAATAFAAAASASAAGSGIGTAASFIDFGMFLAGGGDPPLGKVSIVGERGPELFVPKTYGTVVPLDDFRNSKRAGNVSVTNIINMPQGTSRASADQTGLVVARYTQRAVGKLG